MASNNPYNKIKTRTELSPPEKIKAIFDKAADHLDKTAAAMEKEDYYTRSLESQQAISIISSLAENLTKYIDKCESFTTLMVGKYLGMVIHLEKALLENDIEKCRNLSQYVRAIGKWWYENGVAAATPNAINTEKDA